MRGFEYLETYKKSFNAGSKEDYAAPKVAVWTTEKWQKRKSLTPLILKRKKHLLQRK